MFAIARRTQRLLSQRGKCLIQINMEFEAK